jgi:hypothetical protein
MSCISKAREVFCVWPDQHDFNPAGLYSLASDICKASTKMNASYGVIPINHHHDGHCHLQLYVQTINEKLIGRLYQAKRGGVSFPIIVTPILADIMVRCIQVARRVFNGTRVDPKTSVRRDDVRFYKPYDILFPISTVVDVLHANTSKKVADLLLNLFTQSLYQMTTLSLFPSLEYELERMSTNGDIHSDDKVLVALLNSADWATSVDVFRAYKIRLMSTQRFELHPLIKHSPGDCLVPADAIVLQMSDDVPTSDEVKASARMGSFFKALTGEAVICDDHATVDITKLITDEFSKFIRSTYSGSRRAIMRSSIIAMLQERGQVTMSASKLYYQSMESDDELKPKKKKSNPKQKKQARS